VILPSFSIGFLSMGVLNLNNMRDRISDEKAGKNTLVVKLGAKNAKNYHYALILGAILCLVLFTVLTLESVNDFFYLPAFIPLIMHLKRVVENENATLLDPELKILALSTFATAVLFGLGQIW